MPQIISFEYIDTNNFYGQIKREEIMKNNYIIRFSKSLNDCVQQYQKSVIWHEAIHIYDIIEIKNKFPGKDISPIIASYSEAHAREIQLRYLLKITPTQIVNQGKRYLPYKSNYKEDLGTVTAEYINQSIQAANNFIKSKNPNDFKTFTNNYCYFCGYMRMKKKSDADKLVDCISKSYPQIYQKHLTELYENIYVSNQLMCGIIYEQMLSGAMLYSISQI